MNESLIRDLVKANKQAWAPWNTVDPAEDEPQEDPVMGPGDEPKPTTMYPRKGEDLNPNRVPQPQGWGHQPSRRCRLLV